MSPNDKYRGEDTSQVRDIIQKINDEKPGKESSREEVIRPDGSKAIRVVRKRRVLVSEKDKRRRSRRVFLMGIFLSLITLAGLLIYFLWNLYRMSTSASYEAIAEELRRAWGADSIELDGIEVSGFDLELKGVVVNFGAESGAMVERVVLTKLSGSLQKEGVFTGDYIFEELTVGSAYVTLRAGAEKLKASNFGAQDFVNVKQIVCNDFNLTVGNSADASPFVVKGSELFMRYTDEKKETCSITLNGGDFLVRSWKNFSISDARLLLASSGIEDFRANLLLPEKMAVSAQEGAFRPELYLSGEIAIDSSIYSGYGLDSKFMELADFTEARLISFLSAQTRPNRVDGLNVMASQVSFSPTGLAPSFRGEFLLQNVKWKNIPALQVIMKHLPADRRSQYVQLALTMAKIQLDSTPSQIRFNFEESDMAENYSVTMKGDVLLTEQQGLSGVISYGLPAALTRSEYPDGISDPVFKERGELAWLDTTLSGTAFAPLDDAKKQDLEAAEARKSRPEPYRLDDMDFDQINDNLERLKEVESGASRPAAARPAPTSDSSSTTLF